jgi:hypothetical protein
MMEIGGTSERMIGGRVVNKANVIYESVPKNIEAPFESMSPRFNRLNKPLKTPGPG